MGLTLSVLRIKFYGYCLIARNMLSNEITSLRGKFCELPGSMLDKLKCLHSEVFTEVHWGRLLVFLNFVEQQGSTDEESEQLLIFLFPLLAKCKNSYISERRRERINS